MQLVNTEKVLMPNLLNEKPNSLQQTWLVTNWEFMHFFKWKQEVISKLILVGVALLVMLWQHVKEENHTVYQIAIPMNVSSSKAFTNSNDFNFITTNKTIEELKAGLATGEEWQAILVEKNDEKGIKNITIYSANKLGWLKKLEATLNQQYTLLYANSLGLEPSQLATLSKPAIFTNEYIDNTIKTEENSGEMTAIGMIILLAMGVFTSFGQLFVSVTGEKQQRVTEQLYSCISPQIWIDGKIFGQMLHAFKAMITALFTGLLSYAFVIVVINGQGIDFSIIDWALLPWLVPFAIVGVYLCTAFMAAIAAGIDDPNHSAKTSIMLLPLLPMVITFLTLDSPSGWALTFLSYFPVTSFVAMPVKMALIDIPLWQPILSLAIAIILCLWIRKVAARLFKMGMTMYGKEPSLKEMMKWVFKEG